MTLPPRCRGALLRVTRNRSQHARLDEAAAQRGGHGLAELGVGRSRPLVEECLGGENHAVQAKAALCGLLVDERLLDRMWTGPSRPPSEHHADARAPR